MLFTDTDLVAAAAGDLAVLDVLDRRGLLLAPGELPAAYADRLRQLQGHMAEMDAELAAKGTFSLDTMEFKAGERIDPALFAEAGVETGQKFGFAVDWVPGFYVNPSFAWLFGGCAFSFYPDFFALFIIRKVFAVQDRWLIYSRRELLAHELCHVARIALQSRVFEERFAYQTAQTGFRKLMGSVFRTQADSLGMLSTTMLLLLAQVLQIVLWPGLPIWPFWGLLGAVLLFLGIRHVRDGWRFQRALTRLESGFGNQAMAILFRCTDEEVLALAALPGPAEVKAWMETRAAADWRWKIIHYRFMPNEPAG